MGNLRFKPFDAEAPISRLIPDNVRSLADGLPRISSYPRVSAERYRAWLQLMVDGNQNMIVCTRINQSLSTG